MAGRFRLRVGDYRLIFRMANDEITVIRVRHRSEVYRAPVDLD
jgi:mRNA-degrading endonuclease RelE of RelBE toxin-antitoxin system